MQRRITLALALVLVVGGLPTVAMAGADTSEFTASTIDASSHEHVHASEEHAGDDTRRSGSDTGNVTVDTGGTDVGDGVDSANASDSPTVELDAVRVRPVVTDGPVFDGTVEPPVVDLEAPCWTDRPMTAPCWDVYERVVLDLDHGL
jgi:hypothetical protein